MAVRRDRSLLVVTLLTVSCAASTAPATAVPGAGARHDGTRLAMRVDHVPIAVRSLERAIRTYGDGLGFSIKPGRPHANSIDNAHLKFADGSALELITATEPRDELAARYLAFLARGEGGAFLALDAGRIGPVAEALRPLAQPFDTTIGPYYESLTFTGPPLDYLFFILIHRRPPDLPGHLSHANTAVALHAVWVAGTPLAEERELFERLGYEPRPALVSLPVDGAAHEIELVSGRLYLLEPPGGSSGRSVVGATVEVADLDRALASFAPATAAAAAPGVDARGRFVRVPPARAHGMWLELLERDRPGGR